MEKQTTIYALIDPMSLKIRYIGITCQSLKDRLQNHIHDARYNPEVNWHKANWIRKLMVNKVKPIIRALCVCETREQAEKLESELIIKYKDKHNLINIALGNGEFTSIGQHSASELNSKQVFVYNYDGTFYKEYNSIKECAKDLNIYISCVEKCLYGIYKYAKGFQFSCTKVNNMPSLVNYSTGSSKSVVILNNDTGEVSTFKSGKACKEFFGLNLKTTSVKYILGGLNKYYGNKYSMLVDGKFIQSTYYNTGVIIITNLKEFTFTSKKELLSYMGYKVKSITENKLLNYINTHFNDIKEILFNQPLCLVTNKDN